MHIYIYIYLLRGKPRLRHRTSRCFWAGAFYSRRVVVGAECDKARERTVFGKEEGELER